ncbi:hypothetical protein ACMZ5E_09700 [Streptomyces rhizosphaericola]|uniref:hypothetical protein n=1 Tax=Streptomyces rhizosphaericola TaxID=2564098 RepID=UPI0039F0E81C
MTRKAGGRPWGPIRAENPAAHKLAETLRRHVNDSGKTLAVLGDEINMRKSQTGNYLAGKVPTEAFIIALIQATVRPELRQRRQEEALFLREQAMRPVPRSASGSPAVPAVAVDPEYAVKLAAAQAQQIETYNRLARALEQWAEVEQAKSNSDKLIMVLLHMIYRLDRQVAGLVKERDKLRARPRSEALEAAERKLARAEEHEQRAREELRRAEEKQRQAEDLGARLTDQVSRLTDELDRLRAGDTASPLDTLPALVDGPQEHYTSADPVGDDIEAALAHVSAVNDEDNITLNRVSSELDEPVMGVVQDNPPDNPASPEPPEDYHRHFVDGGQARTGRLDFAPADEPRPDPVPEVVRDDRADNESRSNEDFPPAGQMRSGAALPGPQELDREAKGDVAEVPADSTGPYVQRSGRAGGWRQIRDFLTQRRQNSVIDQADAMGEAGDAAGAVGLLEVLLAELEQERGRENLDWLRVNCDLARWREAAGDTEGAIRELQEVLLIAEPVHGPANTEFVGARMQLAALLGESGDEAGAVRQLEPLVAVLTGVRDPEDLQLLIVRHNLAHWQRFSGDRDGAAAELEGLLRVMVSAHGPTHPDTLTMRQNLANWRGDRDPARAARAMRDLLPLMKQVKGYQHGETISTLRSLAYWQGEAGDVEGAVSALEELVPLATSAYGPDHAETHAARSKLADWRKTAATATKERLVQEERARGPEHPATLASHRSLAHRLEAEGDAAGAARELEKLLPSMVRLQGPESPDVLDLRLKLADLQGTAGEAGTAVITLGELLPGMGRVHGAEHPKTLTVRSRLAHWQGTAGDVEGAVRALEELLPDMANVYEPRHPFVRVAHHELAHWQGVAGDAQRTAKERPLEERGRGVLEHPASFAPHSLPRWPEAEEDAAGAARELERLISPIGHASAAEHSDAVHLHLKLADLQGAAGNADTAVGTLRDLLPVIEQTYGNEDPTTLVARSRLAYWQGAAGDANSAVGALEELLPVMRRIYEPRSRFIRITHHELAHWRGVAGDARQVVEFPLTSGEDGAGHDYPGAPGELARWKGGAAEAVSVLEDLLPSVEDRYGPRHPDALALRHRLANWQGAAGDAAGAARTLAVLPLIREQILGNLHPLVGQTQAHYAYWRNKADQVR